MTALIKICYVKEQKAKYTFILLQIILYGVVRYGIAYNGRGEQLGQPTGCQQAQADPPPRLPAIYSLHCIQWWASAVKSRDIAICALKKNLCGSRYIT